MSDQIKKPSHYVNHPSGIEPREICEYETFSRGNIIKYVMRAPYKGNELQDMRKAAEYVLWEIERLERIESSKANHPSMRTNYVELAKKERNRLESYEFEEYKWDQDDDGDLDEEKFAYNTSKEYTDLGGYTLVSPCECDACHIREKLARE